MSDISIFAKLRDFLNSKGTIQSGELANIFPVATLPKVERYKEKFTKTGFLIQDGESTLVVSQHIPESLSLRQLNALYNLEELHKAV
ncbi:hypothetical protein Molly5_12 [Maribacter phage Molly_5]|uniref:Uncharacterized protein n=1 Tax=Maribacter phage Molly_1 TaxID=2745685 RepID=A0A8E4UY59_9CAUD|nr:hypothetical protein M1M29_gp012 [Maribacter phage Molly_1]QQO97611.1 hypothetical protein Molly2_12 [Maribacter phage Molly_2]QQO97811.1 hypothetical protein Molly3_12 [Maribacter phage Molly_3]QQO98011.1 hypothetical protein Molly4_12 [Maribacter phage Molly_4]QQO98211.1 hypothetical protein Molly5_12 [Maribacter phage Molly_5]QQO97411.1 hypothetical protein Molly1_12 [Maribacter phage Molly_1]